MRLAQHGEIELDQVERSMTPGLHPHRLQYVGISLREHLHMYVMLRFEVCDERLIARRFVGEDRQRDVELVRLGRGAASAKHDRKREGEKSRRCAHWRHSLASVRSMLGAMLRGTFGRHNIVRRVDERDMAEGLWKIPELAAKSGIVFFGEQADVIAQIEQTQVEFARLLMTAGHPIVVGEPERARNECPLTRRETIDAGLGRIPEHQPFVHEFSFDRGDRRSYARILRGQETDQRNHQQRRVERFRSVILDERITLRIEATAANVAMNLVAERSPAIDRSIAKAVMNLFHRSIDCHPRHHLRVRKIPARTAHFPDSFIRILPSRFEEIHQPSLQAPGVIITFELVLTCDVQRVDNFAIDVELKLLMRGVAYTHWTALLIARQPRKLRLNEHSFARDSIHDLSILRMTCYCSE